jgi:hypothetical protein
VIPLSGPVEWQTAVTDMTKSGALQPFGYGVGASALICIHSSGGYHLRQPEIQRTQISASRAGGLSAGSLRGGRSAAAVEPVSLMRAVFPELSATRSHAGDAPGRIDRTPEGPKSPSPVQPGPSSTPRRF